MLRHGDGTVPPSVKILFFPRCFYPKWNGDDKVTKTRTSPILETFHRLNCAITINIFDDGHIYAVVFYRTIMYLFHGSKNFEPLAVELNFIIPPLKFVPMAFSIKKVLKRLSYYVH